MNSQSLIFRYTLSIFIIYTTVSLIISIGYGLNLNNAENSKIKKDLDSLQRSYLEYIKKSLWLTDYADLQQLLNSIVELEYVDYVRLEDDEGINYSAGIYTQLLSETYHQEHDYITIRKRTSK